MSEQGQFKTIKSNVDGIQIRYYKKNITKETTHVLFFLQGRAEWIEKYTFLYDDLCEKYGWGFLAIDHRGQGASGGRPAHVETYDHFASDIGQVVDLELKGKRYSMLAHSMGGLICLYSALRGVIKPEKICLSSPLLGMPQKPIPRIIARPMANVLCNLGLSKLDTAIGSHEKTPFSKNVLTSDEDKYNQIKSSPYKIPSPTFGWVKASYEATDFIFQEPGISSINFPMKLFVGAREEVVDPKSIVKWSAIASKICSHKIDLTRVADAKHELLFEREDIYQKVRNDVSAFLHSDAKD